MLSSRRSRCPVHDPPNAPAVHGMRMLPAIASADTACTCSVQPLAWLALGGLVRPRGLVLTYEPQRR